MGRLVCIIICFWGVFIVSFFVVTLNNLLIFNSNEEKAFNLLLRLFYKGQLKLKAIGVLTSAFRHRNVKLNDSGNVNSVMKHYRYFRQKMFDFTQAAQEVRAFYAGEKQIDLMAKMIESVID